MFTVAEAISKAFRENTDKQSGQISVNIVSSSGVSLKISQQVEDRLGSECSGGDGDQGRVLTLQNTSESGAPVAVWVEDQLIDPADYTVSHLSASSTVTFDNINIFNADTIRVNYYI
jgi:hypothetical protein